MNKPGAASVRTATMDLCGLLFATAAFATLASAEPSWKKELTLAEPGAYPPPPSGILDLQVSWKGILDSGRLRMEIAPRNANKPGSLILRSSAFSLGPAASLFPYQNSFWAELDPVTFKPRFFHSVETDKKETVTTNTRHYQDRVEYSETTRLLKNGTNTQKDRVFKFSPVFDIFSAMLHVRSQKLDAGDHITLVVHPFATPYLLRVKVIGREVHLDRKSIRLNVAMRKIDRKTLELLPYKKLKSDATLWLSDDADRLPVEFRAAVFIGDIRATLTGFKKS